MARLPAAAVAALLAAAAFGAGPDNWPAFRGGEHAGVAEADTLPDAWGPERNVVWKVEIPGRGWSSPVVWGDRVFATSVATDGRPPEPRKGLYIQDIQGKVPPGEHRWLVHCLDFRTGKTLWQREAFRGRPAGPHHIKNNYASATPVTDGERVYAAFGNTGLVCCDLDGAEVWKQTWPARKSRMGWGPAASPALADGRLYVVDDNEEESSLACLDARTGKELWKVGRDEKSNWASPYVWRHDSQTEVVTAGTNKVRSYGPEGKLLWELGGMSMIAIPTPFARDGLLYVTSGYVMDSNRPLYAVRPGASGDLTPGKEGGEGKHLAWVQKLAGPYNPSPLVYGDYLYVLYDKGFLACFEAKSGKPVYPRQQLPGATAVTASPWAYGGKVFCLSEDGDTFVVQAGPEFKLLGTNRLDEMCLATPALAHGSLVLRTQGHLYRFQKDAGTPGK
jgi:outer membrane protein assembly factor BamB